MKLKVKVIDGKLKFFNSSNVNVQELNITGYILRGKRLSIADLAAQEVISRFDDKVIYAIFEDMYKLCLSTAQDSIPVYCDSFVEESRTPIAQFGIVVAEDFFTESTSGLTRYVPCDNLFHSVTYIIARESDTELSFKHVGAVRTFVPGMEIVVNMGENCDRIWESLQKAPRLVGGGRMVTLSPTYNAAKCVAGIHIRFGIDSYIDIYSDSGAYYMFAGECGDPVPNAAICEITNFLFDTQQVMYKLNPFKVISTGSEIQLKGGITLPVECTSHNITANSYADIKVSSTTIGILLENERIAICTKDAINIFNEASLIYYISEDMFIDLVRKLREQATTCVIDNAAKYAISDNMTV